MYIRLCLHCVWHCVGVMTCFDIKHFSVCSTNVQHHLIVHFPGNCHSIKILDIKIYNFGTSISINISIKIFLYHAECIECQQLFVAKKKQTETHLVPQINRLKQVPGASIPAGTRWGFHCGKSLY